MATLQQGEATRLRTEGSSSVLCVHRRTSTVLILDKIAPTGDNGKLYLRTCRLNFGDFSASYHLAENISAESQILCAVPLESYEAFLLLVNAPGCRQALFFTLDMKLVTNCSLSYVHDSNVKTLPMMACADVDQKRKDLTVGTFTGRVYSFAVRMIDKVLNQKSGRFLKSVMTFQSIQRTKAKLDASCGKYAVRLVALDLTGTTLVLYDTGSLQCLETQSLEPLWTVSYRCFRYKPVNIWGDKFGSHFVLHCKADTVEGLESMLEYWVPPEAYSICMTGSFFRSCIPLDRDLELSTVCIESIAEQNTHVLVRESSGRIQLWRPEDDVLVLLCTLAPSVSHMPSSSCAVMLFKEPSASLTSKIAILVATGEEALEIALHYPSVSDQQWLGVGRHLEVAFGKQSRGDEPSPRPEQPLDAFLKPPVAVRDSENLTFVAAIVRDSSKKIHLDEITDSLSVNEEDTIESVSSQQLSKDPVLINVEDVPVSIIIEKPTTEEASVSDKSATYDPNTVRRPPSPDYTILEKVSEIDTPRIFNERDIKPPEAFYFLPNIVIADRRTGEGNLVMTKNPTLFIRDTPSSVDTLRVISLKGFRNVSAPTPPGAVPDIRLVGVATRARLITVVTSLRETFVYSLASADGHSTLPLRLELPLLHKELATIASVADVSFYLNTYPSSSSSQKSSKSKTIISSEKTGHYAISFVGDSAGNVFYAISTADKLYQVGSWKAHSCSVAAIATTGDSCRFSWRISISVIDGTTMVSPSSFAGSAVITVADDGEVKVWQPVFLSSRSILGCREEDIFLAYQIMWKTVGLFSAVEATPGLGTSVLVSSLAIDPSCLYIIVGFSNGFLAHFPIPGVVPSGSATVAVCKQPSWFEKRHAVSIASVRVFTAMGALQHGIPVHSNETARAEAFVLQEKCSNYVVGYTLADLRSLVESSSLVTSSVDGSLGLWRFIIKATSGDDFITNRILVPVFCRTLVFSQSPLLGICIEVSRDMWSLSAIVNGVVVTALTGSKSKVFAKEVSEAPVVVHSSEKDKSLTSVATIPVFGSILKPLQVAELMPIRQPDGMYSWLTLNDWAAEEVATLPQHYALDESDQSFTLEDEAALSLDKDKVPPVARIGSAALQAKANVVQVEFTDEIDTIDESVAILNGVFVQPTKAKPLDVMRNEFSPSRYLVDHTEIIELPMLKKPDTDTTENFFWSDDISSSDVGEKPAAISARKSFPSDDSRRKREEYVIDLTLSPSIPGLSLNSYMESMRAMTIVVEPPSPDEINGQPQVPPLEFSSIGGAAMTKSASLRIKKTTEITKRLKLFENDEPKVKYLSKSANLTAVPSLAVTDGQKKRTAGTPLIGMPKSTQPLSSLQVIVKKPNVPKYVVDKPVEAAFPTNQTKGIPPQKNNNFATMIPAFTSSSNAAVLSTIDTKDSDKQDTTVPASYALPPNYFDRNAKPIIVSRKEKNYSQSVIYKTKTIEKTEAVEETQKTSIEVEEVQPLDWELFLADGEVDRYKMLFVELIKMERTVQPDMEPTMTVEISFILKLPDIVRAIMRRVVTTDEVNDDEEGGSRLKYPEFNRMYKTFENWVSSRCAPPLVSCKVGKCGSKKILVNVTTFRAETVVVFASLTELRSENIAPALDNIAALRLIKDISAIEVVSLDKLEIRPTKEPVEETLTLSLAGLIKKTEYFVYCYGYHSLSLTGRPNRVSNETIFSNFEKATTKARTEVVLDIEWFRLNSEHQELEVRAAARDLEVQAVLKTNKKVFLPSDDEIITMKEPTGRTAQKKYNDFVMWWTGGDLKGGFSDARLSFLRREALFASRDTDVVNDSVKSEALSSKETSDLHAAVSNHNGEAPTEMLLYNENFNKFRLWYTGAKMVKIPKPGEEDEEEEDEPPEPTKDEILVIEQKRQLRLVARTNLLSTRLLVVDKRKEDAAALIVKHNNALRRSLQQEDLELRLYDLSDEDLDFLMASIRVISLCSDAGGINPAAIVPSQHLQQISGEDLFRAMPEEYLIPDEPPALTPMCLPGTNRRPLKPWFRCSDDEKRVELQMASSLDRIVELSVIDGVRVPNLEDFLMDGKIAPSRVEIARAFEEWYTGDEGVCKIKGKGIPSLARVLFAEYFEAEHAVRSEDFAIIIEQLGVVIKIPLSPTTHYSGDDKNVTLDFNPQKYEPRNYFEKYEEAIMSPDGVYARVQMILFQIDCIISCRRFSMNKTFWPPGSNRVGKQFMFPRVGFPVPLVAFPRKRYKLFPSRTRDSYHMAEIMSWFEKSELDRDDAAMRRAERAGAKKARYLEWLAQEQTRIEEGRAQMLREDKTSRIHREYWNFLGGSKENQQIDFTGEKDFAFSNPLPKTFEYIKTSTVKYLEGSGADNEDEIADIREEQARKQAELIEEMMNRKKVAALERKRREEEERLRKLREESDRRLAEGIEKRRQLRIHLANVKLEHEQAADAAEKKLREEAELARAKEIEDKLALEVRLAELVIQRRQEHELQLMRAEEVMLRDVYIRRREIQNMEHEDICSFIARKVEADAELDREMRIQKLKKLYVEHKPFIFGLERTESLYSSSLDYGAISSADMNIGVTREVLGGASTSDWGSEGGFALQQSSEAMKFYPSVSQQLLLSQHDVSPNKPFRIKKPIIWSGLSEKDESNTKHIEDTKARYYERLDEMMRSPSILPSDVSPARVRSANSTLRSMGLPRSIVKTLDPLDVGSLHSKPMSAKSAKVKGKSKILQRSEDLHFILKSVTGASASLHDQSLDIYATSDLASQEILEQKNAHLLASLSALEPFKPKSTKNTLDFINYNRYKMKEFLELDTFRSNDNENLVPYFLESLKTDVRDTTFLEQNVFHIALSKDLDENASDNPLLKHSPTFSPQDSYTFDIRSPSKELFLEKNLKAFSRKKQKRSKKLKLSLSGKGSNDEDGVEILPPPYYHKSLAFFGKKIELTEHDPRLGKNGNAKVKQEIHPLNNHASADWTAGSISSSASVVSYGSYRSDTGSVTGESIEPLVGVKMRSRPSRREKGESDEGFSYSSHSQRRSREHSKELHSGEHSQELHSGEHSQELHSGEHSTRSRSGANTSFVRTSDRTSPPPSPDVGTIADQGGDDDESIGSNCSGAQTINFLPAISIISISSKSSHESGTKQTQRRVAR